MCNDRRDEQNLMYYPDNRSLNQRWLLLLGSLIQYEALCLAFIKESYCKTVHLEGIPSKVFIQYYSSTTRWYLDLFLFKLAEVFPKAIFYIPPYLFLFWLIEDHPYSTEEFSCWTLLRVFCLPPGRSLIFLSLQDRLMMLIFYGGLYSLMLREIGTFYPRGRFLLNLYRILLLTKCCPLRYVTFLANRTTFLVKCVAFIMESVSQLISLL